jgi:hypothetical protein
MQRSTDGSSTVVFKTHFQRGNRGHRRLQEGKAPTARPVDPGRVPRISRLMALAIRLDGLVRSGAVRDYADLARLGHVSRARISQIVGLLNLAPDIQEAVLLLPRTVSGRDPVTERMVRPIAAIVNWREQRRLWRDLRRRAGLDAEARDVA